MSQVRSYALTVASSPGACRSAARLRVLIGQDNGCVAIHAPVDKPTLLAEMQRQFGLRYEIAEAPAAVNATGIKPHYYSLNRRAVDFGYIPTKTSIEGILEEARVILMHGVGL